MLDQAYIQMAKVEAIKHSIPLQLILDLIDIESSGNPKAVSPTGCTGLMQLSKAVAKDYGVTDRSDPQQNIRAGTAYLKSCIKAFPDNLLHALLAYNQGITGARRMLNGERPMAEEGRRYMEKFKKRGW